MLNSDRKGPRIGPLLDAVLSQQIQLGVQPTEPIGEDALGGFRVAAADHIGPIPGQPLPLVAKAPTNPPKKGERWESYRDRILNYLGEIDSTLASRHGLKSWPLIAANSFQTAALEEQIAELSTDPEAGVDLVELDPLLQVIRMDDVVRDVGLPTFLMQHPDRDGTGVTVAVLDTGIDTEHDFLEVADSVSTTFEDASIPGKHGTHCAGSIASGDAAFPGIAPGVTLLNVKVLNAAGQGKHTEVARGVDEALDRDAQILSLSLGFNHLPRDSEGGHGWWCPDGGCVLCTAVNNAVLSDNAIVVVAAGNEHERAERLRSSGRGSSFDTELGCPGQAQEGLTVGAIEKGPTHSLAGFSSRGPTAYGHEKPDVCAPGVNITSTIPMPRNRNGSLQTPPSRELLFGRDSGTSMATPVVAGAIALLLPEKIDNGEAWTGQEVRDEFLQRAAVSAGDPTLFGRGVLSLTNL